MSTGYTKAYRKELNSDIWRMPPLYQRVFFYLRQKAVWKPEVFPTRKGFGIALNTGQLVTSFSAIAEGVSWYEYGVKKVPNKKIIKDILWWLEGNDMVTAFSNAYGTFIIITNWDTYNGNDKEKVTQEEIPKSGQELCSNEHLKVTPKKRLEYNKNNMLEKTPAEVVTQEKRHVDTLKEGKESLRIKEINKEIKKVYKEKHFEFVFLTKGEYQKLKDKFGEDTEERIERLNDYLGSTGKKYKSHYYTILNWSRRGQPNKQSPPKLQPQTYAQAKDAEQREMAQWLLKKMEGKNENNSDGSNAGSDSKTKLCLPQPPASGGLKG